MWDSDWSVVNTYLSSCPLRTMFGPQPIRVPTPPTLAAKATQSFSAHENWENSLSSLAHCSSCCAWPTIDFNGCFSASALQTRNSLLLLLVSLTCPLCQEVEETTVHQLGKRCALINQRLEILGSYYLEYEDLALLHWRPLLRLAMAS